MDTSDFQKGMEKARRGLKNAFGPEALDMSQNIASGFAAVGAAFAAMGIASVKMASDMQAGKKAFTTLLGDAQKAEFFISDLAKFAAQTPFELPGLMDASKKLLAFGFAAEDIIPMMAAIGDAAALMGIGQEGINRLTTAIGQMQAKGKVSAEEMMQIAETGIPAWQMLADAMGISIPEAMKKAEQGTIDSTTGINALLVGMQSRFKGGMEGLSKEVTGLFSTVKDNASAVMREVGDKIIEGFDLKGKLQGAADFLSQFADYVKTSGINEALKNLIPKELSLAIFVVAGALVAAAIPAMIAFGISVWTALAPLLPFIAAGAALGAVAWVIWQAWEPLGDLFTAVWNKAVADTELAWANIKIAVYTGVQYILQAVQPLLSLFGGGLQDTVAGWMSALSGGIAAAGAEARAAAEQRQAASKGIGNALSSIGDKLRQGAAAINNSVSGSLNTTFTGLHGTSAAGGEAESGSGIGGSSDAALNKYEHQLDKMAELTASLESKILDETGTTLEKGAAKLNAEVVKMQNDINEALAAGVDVAAAQDALNRYSKTMSDALEKNWRKAWQDLKDESAVAHAKLTDDASAEAEAEYQITKTKLAKEREEKEKAVQRDGNDAEARLAVAQWYNEQLALADRERLAKQRESHLKLYDQIVEHNNLLLQLEGKTRTEIDQLNRRELQAKIAYLDQELQYAALTKDERLKLEKEKVEAIQKMNDIGAKNLADSFALAAKEIQDQQFNYKELMINTWNDINSAVGQHFKAIFTGAESMSEGIKGVILDLKNSILEMFAEILYQQYILGPIKNWFTGLLGGLSGSSSAAAAASGGSGLNLGGINTGSGIPMAASGGIRDGWTIVGEEGPELVNFTNPGRVYTARDTQNMLNSTLAQRPVVVNMHITTPDANSFRQSQGQIMAGLNVALASGRRFL